MSTTLHYEITRPAALCSEMRREMYALMARCYECVSIGRFEQDLEGKDRVILLRDGDERLRGFSTQQCFDMEQGGKPVRILFSGDTIIDPACWGTVELVRGWCQVAAEQITEHPGVPLFWFLISKGYRTWLYLPLFFHQFLPSPSGGVPPEWHTLLQAAARQKFGDAYDSASGLIRFPDSLGQLSPELAAIPASRTDDPNVRFFLERNADYARGVELACLCEVSLENTRGPGRRMLAHALEQFTASPA